MAKKRTEPVFYEAHRSHSNYLFFTRMDDHAFPLHLHMSFEVLFVEEGEMTISVNGTEYRVSAGHAALVLPNQIHRFATPLHSVSDTCIFSVDLLPDFYRELTDPASAHAHHPVFPLSDPALPRRIPECGDSAYRLKSLLYALAADYEAGPVCDAAFGTDYGLLFRFVQYLDRNFSEKITLHTAAKALGYNYRYLSGLVNRCFQTPFPDLLNSMRINYACTLLCDPRSSSTDISQKCGYETLRSFNRNFRKITGMSPRDYVRTHDMSFRSRAYVFGASSADGQNREIPLSEEKTT